MELTFAIAMYSDDVDRDTLLYLYFPFYYSAGLVDQERDLYCKTGEFIVTCTVDASHPHRLKVQDFGVFYKRNTKFNLTVFGIRNPSYELRYASSYENETIFIAVDTKQNGTLAEMMHLTPPPTQ